jgi:hypothetical protein
VDHELRLAEFDHARPAGSVDDRPWMGDGVDETSRVVKTRRRPARPLRTSRFSAREL